tara:strand:+ start:12934 stop:13062 length:129 start_codon:yes stop_codon:yes gene_type:complete
VTLIIAYLIIYGLDMDMDVADHLALIGCWIVHIGFHNRKKEA